MLDFDLYLSQFLMQFVRPELPLGVVAFLAVGLIWLLFVLILFRASRLPGRVDKIIFLARSVCAVLIGLGINALIAYFYFRARPFVTWGFDPFIAKPIFEKSFPSDHAAIAAALAAMLWRYDKTSGYGGALVAVLISLGRVLAGVHYLSDVIVGAAIGLTASYIVFQTIAVAKKKE